MPIIFSLLDRNTRSALPQVSAKRLFQPVRSWTVYASAPDCDGSFDAFARTPAGQHSHGAERVLLRAASLGLTHHSGGDTDLAAGAGLRLDSRHSQR